MVGNGDSKMSNDDYKQMLELAHMKSLNNALVIGAPEYPDACESCIWVIESPSIQQTSTSADSNG